MEYDELYLKNRELQLKCQQLLKENKKLKQEKPMQLTVDEKLKKCREFIEGLTMDIYYGGPAQELLDTLDQETEES